MSDETELTEVEKRWIKMIQRGLMPPQQRGDLTQCESCKRWFNVPCKCDET